MKILATARLQKDVSGWLVEQGWTLEEFCSDGPCDPAWLSERIAGADALISMVTDRVDADLIDRAKRLRVVSQCAVGFDNIDVQYCGSKGIWVTHTPGVLTNATADLAMALLLAVSRNVIPADRWLRSGNFKGWGLQLFLGAELAGKTLGIVGFGKIGRAMAKRALGFDMRVIAANRSPFRDESVKQVPFDELIAKSDFVSIHCPYNQETHHLFSSSVFEKMREGSILINTARGPIVDEKALVDALRSGKLSGAGLDVFEDEPKVRQELIGMEEVVILPHIGSATVPTRMKMAMAAAKNADRVLKEAFEGVSFVPGSKTPPQMS